MEGEGIQPVGQAGVKTIRLTPPLPAGLVYHTEGGPLAAHICQSHLSGTPLILQGRYTLVTPHHDPDRYTVYLSLYKHFVT